MLKFDFGGEEILVSISGSIKQHLIMLRYSMYYAISGHLHYQCWSLQDFLAPGSIHTAYQQIYCLIGNQMLIHEFIKAFEDMLL